MIGVARRETGNGYAAGALMLRMNAIQTRPAGKAPDRSSPDQTSFFEGRCD
jgi:hypothetical protein